MMTNAMVGHIQAAADQVARAGRSLSGTGPGAAAFGAGAHGLLGTLGQEAHQRWQAALDARAREAAAHAARLRDFADLVQRSILALAVADDEARRETDVAGGEGVG